MRGFDELENVTSHNKETTVAVWRTALTNKVNTLQEELSGLKEDSKSSASKEDQKRIEERLTKIEEKMDRLFDEITNLKVKHSFSDGRSWIVMIMVPLIISALVGFFVKYVSPDTKASSTVVIQKKK